MATHQEQYDKVHDYLLEQGQQELAGHLDSLWNELNDLRKKAESPDQDHTSAQDFQDNAKTDEADPIPPVSSDEPGRKEQTQA